MNALPEFDDFSRHPEQEVFAWLVQNEIDQRTHSHPATFTVADSAKIKTDLPGGHTKNLFLKDKKDSLVLVSAWAQSELPLNHLHKVIGTQRLSFAKADRLWEELRVTPGSVSAFALIHDETRKVRFVVDQALMGFDIVNFHPLRCDMTTAISQKHFIKFIESTGRKIESVDFSSLSA